MKIPSFTVFLQNTEFNLLCEFPHHPLKDGLVSYIALQLDVCEEQVLLALDEHLGC